MNVLIINHKNIFSGAEKVLLDTVTQDRDCEYIIYCHKGSFFSRLVELPNARIIVAPVNGGLRNNSGFINVLYPFLLFFEYVFLLHVVIKENVNVLHFNTYFSAVKYLPVSIILRVFRKKIIWTLHDIHNQALKKFIVLALRVIYHNTIVVSKATKQSLLLHDSNLNTSIVYNGLSSKKLPVLNSSKELNFYVIGMLTPWKGQLEIISAFLKMECNGKLHIIGDGDDGYKQKLVNVIKGNTKVRLHGWKANPWEVIERNSKTFVFHCSIEPDPLPTVVLEAAQRGILAFVSKYGGGQRNDSRGTS